MKKALTLLILTSVILNAKIYVYGPGGPAPVIKEIAKVFSSHTGEEVEVIAGPTSKWMPDAKKQADIIYSGNSSMMDSFVKELNGKISSQKIQVLNIREAGIIVRPNNPKNIKTFQDLLKPGVKVMVVNGAGQVGLYEDMALKNGNRSNLVKLRKNIEVFAPNSKSAVNQWNQNQSIDALIIWKHWANVIGEDKARFISLNDESKIFRASEIVIANDSKNAKIAQQFIDFLLSKNAQKVWERHGWIAQ